MTLAYTNIKTAIRRSLKCENASKVNKNTVKKGIEAKTKTRGQHCAIQALGEVPAAPFPIQLPLNTLGEQGSWT